MVNAGENHGGKHGHEAATVTVIYASQSSHTGVFRDAAVAAVAASSATFPGDGSAFTDRHALCQAATGTPIHPCVLCPQLRVAFQA